MKNKVTSKLLTVVSMLVLMFVFTISANAITAGNSIEKAYAIEFNTNYSESISESSRMDYYKMTLPSSGRVSISFTSYMQYYSIYIYNSEGYEVWRTEENEWVSNRYVEKYSFSRS